VPTGPSRQQSARQQGRDKSRGARKGATAILNPRRHGPLLAQLLVVALLIGSLPMAASPVIAEHESTPAFTLDICHPLAAFVVGTASCTLAAFAAYSFSIVIDVSVGPQPSEITGIDRAGEAPDTPPPKMIA